MGRRKIEITEVKNRNAKQVTFSKRRKGLFKKANELSILCGVEVAIVVFSPGNKPYSFGHPSVDVVADKFLQQDPKSNVVETKNDDDDVQGNNSSSEVGDMDRLNQQLYDVEAQLCEEQTKVAKVDHRLRRQKMTQLSENKELQGSCLELKLKVDCMVDDYFNAMEVSEYLLLLAKQPMVQIAKKVTKKRRKN